MLPTLFAFGPLVIRSLTLLVIVALVGVAFLFWRKAREEHYDEMEIFDVFLASSLAGLVASRIAFIVFRFPQFGFDPLKWLNIFGHPGFNLSIGLVAAALFLFRQAEKRKWDAYEIIDFWVIGTSFGLAAFWLGMLLDGTSFGYATSMPWGVVFPGVFEKHHPVQLYFSAFFFALFGYLSWAEYRYRTFGWYRAGKNTAQTGFLTSIFIAATGLFSLIMLLVRPGQFTIARFSLDLVVYAVMFVGGLVMLFIRSGRSFLPTQRRTTPFKVE